MNKTLFLIMLLVLSACAEVDSPPLADVPPVPEQHHLAEDDKDAVTDDEISEIIKKREELLKSGE